MRQLTWLRGHLPDRGVGLAVVTTGKQYRRPDGVDVVPLACRGPDGGRSVDRSGGASETGGMTRLAAAVAAFVSAAMAFAFVAVDRWWPCAVEGLASTACGLRQDDTFDALVTPGGPYALHWAVRVAAYLLAGAGSVLAGRASGTPRARRCGWFAAVLPWATGAALAGWFDGPGVGATLAFVTLAVGFLGACSVRPLFGGRRGWPSVYGAGLVAASLLADHYLAAPLINAGYASWDTTPWTWLSSALACGVAALVLAGPGRQGARAVASGRPLATVPTA